MRELKRPGPLTSALDSPFGGQLWLWSTQARGRVANDLRVEVLGITDTKLSDAANSLRNSGTGSGELPRRG